MKILLACYVVMEYIGANTTLVTRHCEQPHVVIAEAAPVVKAKPAVKKKSRKRSYVRFGVTPQCGSYTPVWHGKKYRCVRK